MINKLFWWFDDHSGKFLIILILSVLFGLGALVKHDLNRRLRLMNQCMKDGHKEYQCEGWLESGKDSSTFIMFPVRTR